MTGWERTQTVGIVIVATLAGIGALYVGRDLCIPLALALLLNALLRPVVRGLERLRVATVVGATVVSLGLLGVLVAGGLTLVHPVQAWVSQLPASFAAAGRVAYLGAADNVSGPLLIRLREVNQPMISTPNRFSRPRPRLLACI